MTTQVYYRKWRPQQLSDLVGQEAVVRTLKQALLQKRVAHAYLFCGPRGTGKTSTARILAKAVNCLSPLEEGEPDNTCHLCLAITEGRSLDLIEIDAASNRGIDEIRSLREKVHFAPAESAYKVYILDEAHMLTDAAADALLKTLEEPPAHVIFILATTEAHKLPSTIISRCQRFDFRRISPTDIVERLARIAEAEGMSVKPEALRALARSASGSLRDAENLLEQTVTSFGDSIGLEQVRELLGLTSDDRPRALVGHLLHGEAAAGLSLMNAIASEGLNLHQLHRQVMGELRDLMLLKSGATEMVDQPAEVLQEQSSLIADVPLERLLRAMRLLGQVTFRHDTPDALPLELALVECTLDESPAEQAPLASTTPEPVSSPKPSVGSERPVDPPGKARRPGSSTPQEPKQVSPRKPTVAPPAPAPTAPSVAPPPPTMPRSEPVPAAGTPASPAPSSTNAPGRSASAGHRDDRWEELIKTLSRHKGRRFNLGALLRACRHHLLDGDTLTLDFTHRSHMERMQEEMEYPESRRTFLEAVGGNLGVTGSLSLVFTAVNGQQQTTSQSAESPLVKAAVKMGGKILETGDDPGEPQPHKEPEKVPVPIGRKVLDEENDLGEPQPHEKPEKVSVPIGRKVIDTGFDIGEPEFDEEQENE